MKWVLSEKNATIPTQDVASKFHGNQVKADEILRILNISLFWFHPEMMEMYAFRLHLILHKFSNVVSSNEGNKWKWNEKISKLDIHSKLLNGNKSESESWAAREVIRLEKSRSMYGTEKESAWDTERACHLLTAVRLFWICTTFHRSPSCLLLEKLHMRANSDDTNRILVPASHTEQYPHNFLIKHFNNLRDKRISRWIYCFLLMFFLLFSISTWSKLKFNASNAKYIYFVYMYVYIYL